jgi:hypothetical protein
MKVAFVMILQALVLCVGSSAWGDTVHELLRGTSDAVAGTVDVQILTDADSVATAFQAVTPAQTLSIGFQDLANGVVLLNYQGYDVAILQSNDFDPAHGGTMKITYLRNALANSYKSITVDLVRDGDEWHLMVDDQAGHHVVTQGFFKANKFFGQVVGIDSIILQ